MRKSDDELPIHHLNAAWINDATQRARDIREKLMAQTVRMLADAGFEPRLVEGLCPTCFYINRFQLAGQAFSSWRCSGCDEVQPMWPNTAVPKVCKPCSEKYQVCVRCCADLDLRVRKNLLVKGRTSRKRR